MLSEPELQEGTMGAPIELARVVGVGPKVEQPAARTRQEEVAAAERECRSTN